MVGFSLSNISSVAEVTAIDRKDNSISRALHVHETDVQTDVLIGRVTLIGRLVYILATVLRIISLRACTPSSLKFLQLNIQASSLSRNSAALTSRLKREKRKKEKKKNAFFYS